MDVDDGGGHRSMARTLLTESATNRLGRVESSGEVIRDADTGALLVRPLLSDAVLRTAARCHFGLEEFVGGRWRHVVSAEWVGPSDPAKPDEIPAIEIPVERVRGKTVRGFTETPTRIACGLEVATREPQML